MTIMVNDINKYNELTNKQLVQEGSIFP